MKIKWTIFLVILLSLGAHADDNSRQVIGFGDSLSDPGNYYVEFEVSTTAPFEPVPSAPYENKGFRFRFTDGKTWIERLAGELGNSKGGKPALDEPLRFTNYAVGRARARALADTPGLPPGFQPFHLTEQVERFLTDFGGNAPPDALYSVWIGSNDLFEAIAVLEFDPSSLSTLQIIEAAITRIFLNLIELHSAGAKTFLVPNLPNAGVTPAVLAQSATIPDLPFIAQMVSEQYNNALEDALITLELLFPDIQIIRLDVFSIVNEVVANPSAFGLTNVTDSCITPGVVEDAICDRPNKYLFWDFVHPTRTTHRILSRRAEDAFEDFLNNN